MTTSESQSATQPNESTESMITSDEIENTESSTQRFDPDWFQKLEERRKEIEQSLEDAKNQLKENQETIHQDLTELKENAQKNHEQLEQNLAHAQEIADATQKDIDGKIQKAKEIQEQIHSLGTDASTTLTNTQSDIETASAEIDAKIQDEQAAIEDAKAKKTDLESSIGRIKSILHSAGSNVENQEVYAADTKQSVEPLAASSTVKELPKTNDEQSIGLVVLGLGLISFTAILMKKRA